MLYIDQFPACILFYFAPGAHHGCKVHWLCSLLQLGDSVHSNSLLITHKGGFSLGLQRSGFHKAFREGFHDAFTVRFKGNQKTNYIFATSEFSRVSGCKTI